MVWNPTPSSNTHIDKVLTQISIAYPNNAFVGSQFMPPVRVQKQSDLYSVFGRETWVLEPGDDLRAPGAESYEIPGLERSLVPYYAKEHSLQTPIHDESRENADAPLSPDRDGTELVTAKILLGRELDIRVLLQNAANYAAGHTVTLAGVNQFNDYTSSDPVSVIKTGRRQLHSVLFMEPTKTMIPWQVLSFMEDHPDFIERIKYSQTGILTKDLIGAVLGIRNIVVPEAGYNTAAMGATEALAYIWGKDILMAMVPPRAAQNTPAFGYEFVWRYPGGQEQITERWREQQRKSDIIRVSRRYDLKLTTLDGGGLSTAGYLIKNAIA